MSFDFVKFIDKIDFMKEVGSWKCDIYYFFV